MFAFLGLGATELIICFPLLVLFPIWIWMLIDCLQNAPSQGNEKLTWVLVIILLGPLGAILYLILQRHKWKRPDSGDDFRQP